LRWDTVVKCCKTDPEVKIEINTGFKAFKEAQTPPADDTVQKTQQSVKTAEVKLTLLSSQDIKEKSSLEARAQLMQDVPVIKFPNPLSVSHEEVEWFVFPYIKDSPYVKLRIGRSVVGELTHVDMHAGQQGWESMPKHVFQQSMDDVNETCGVSEWKSIMPKMTLDDWYQKRVVKKLEETEARLAKRQTKGAGRGSHDVASVAENDDEQDLAGMDVDVEDDGTESKGIKEDTPAPASRKRGISPVARVINPVRLARRELFPPTPSEMGGQGLRGNLGSSFGGADEVDDGNASVAGTAYTTRTTGSAGGSGVKEEDTFEYHRDKLNMIHQIIYGKLGVQRHAAQQCASRLFKRGHKGLSGSIKKYADDFMLAENLYVDVLMATGKQKLDLEVRTASLKAVTQYIPIAKLPSVLKVNLVKLSMLDNRHVSREELFEIAIHLKKTDDDGTFNVYTPKLRYVTIFETDEGFPAEKDGQPITTQKMFRDIFLSDVFVDLVYGGEKQRDEALAFANMLVNKFGNILNDGGWELPEHERRFIVQSRNATKGVQCLLEPWRLLEEEGLENALTFVPEAPDDLAAGASFPGILGSCLALTPPYKTTLDAILASKAELLALSNDMETHVLSFEEVCDSECDVVGRVEELCEKLLASLKNYGAAKAIPNLPGLADAFGTDTLDHVHKLWDLLAAAVTVRGRSVPEIFPKAVQDCFTEAAFYYPLDEKVATIKDEMTEFLAQSVVGQQLELISNTCATLLATSDIDELHIDEAQIAVTKLHLKQAKDSVTAKTFERVGQFLIRRTLDQGGMNGNTGTKLLALLTHMVSKITQPDEAMRCNVQLADVLLQIFFLQKSMEQAHMDAEDVETIDYKKATEDMNTFHLTIRAETKLRELALPGENGTHEYNKLVNEVSDLRQKACAKAQHTRLHVQDQVVRSHIATVSNKLDALKKVASGGDSEETSWMGNMTKDALDKMSWVKLCEFLKSPLRAPTIPRLEEEYNEVLDAYKKMLEMAVSLGRKIDATLDADVEKVTNTAAATFIVGALYVTLSSGRTMKDKRDECREVCKEVQRFRLKEAELLPKALLAQLTKVRNSL